MLGALNIPKIISAIVFAMQVCACRNPPAPEPDPHSSTQVLAHSLSSAVRDFCLPYVVDGASDATLTRRAGVTSLPYSIHGKRVIFHRLDLPGTPQVVFSEGEYCRVWIDREPFSDRVAIVDLFMAEAGSLERPTGEYHRSVGPGVLTVERSDGFYGRTICMYGQHPSAVSASAAPDVTASPFGGELHNPPTITIIVRSDIRPENCPAPEGN
ncbi:MAG: hypothetical protein AB7Q23_15970 [Hyphomonadaceae bacterium]